MEKPLLDTDSIANGSTEELQSNILFCKEKYEQVAKNNDQKVYSPLGTNFFEKNENIELLQMEIQMLKEKQEQLKSTDGTWQKKTGVKALIMGVCYILFGVLGLFYSGKETPTFLIVLIDATFVLYIVPLLVRIYDLIMLWSEKRIIKSLIPQNHPGKEIISEENGKLQMLSSELQQQKVAYHKTVQGEFYMELWMVYFSIDQLYMFLVAFEFVSRDHELFGYKFYSIHNWATLILVLFGLIYFFIIRKK